jgi:hypothetical protein
LVEDRIQVLCHQAHLCPGTTQENELCQRRLAATDQQRNAPSEAEEDRQIGKPGLGQRAIRRREGVHEQ